MITGVTNRFLSQGPDGVWADITDDLERIQAIREAWESTLKGESWCRFCGAVTQQRLQVGLPQWLMVVTGEWSCRAHRPRPGNVALDSAVVRVPIRFTFEGQSLFSSLTDA